MVLTSFRFQACGKPVGVHISRARSLEQAVEEQQNLLLDDCDPDKAINKLLRLIRSHSDKRGAVTAALKAVLAVPSRPKSTSADRCGHSPIFSTAPEHLPQPSGDPHSSLALATATHWL